MTITASTLIQIHWEGSYKLEDLPQLMNDKIDYGIYQIYGTHPVYGNDVLLYIGKADSQTLGKRISQENWLYTNDSNNHKIYIGRLHGAQPLNEEIWSTYLDLAERLLIYTHKPAYNARSIASFPDKELQLIHVLNWGHHRSLFPEVSGLRWTSKLDDVEYEVFRVQDEEASI